MTKISEEDLATVVAVLLDEIDPATLEALALSKLEGLEGGLTTGEAFISALKEMILGGD